LQRWRTASLTRAAVDGGIVAASDVPTCGHAFLGFPANDVESDLQKMVQVCVGSYRHRYEITHREVKKYFDTMTGSGWPARISVSHD